MQEDIIRYSCQVALPGFGLTGQQKLQQAKVLIVGAGGLGCPTALYLASAGVGTLAIADFDVISPGNLHRQVLYNPAEAGLKKAVIACNKLGRQNPQIKLIPLDVKITSANVMGLVEAYDIVVDCTDNFDARYLLNDACVLAGKPLVYGAIYQFEGQVAVWNVLNVEGTRSPNYRDVFPQVDASQIPNCAEGGVLPTIAGIIGCMQANEVIKFIAGTGDLLAGKILILDALTLQSRIIKTGTVTKTTIKEITETIDIPVISVNELRQADIDSYILVDVRSVEERAQFNIGGLHIPIESLEQDLSFLTGGKLVVFYCASGKRSAEAVKKVKQVYPQANIFSLEGGMKAWQEQS
jgi:molybdopterin/thiamine biosynthesis adenylyltransferase/rhodanese-related sulfurtransferase